LRHGRPRIGGDTLSGFSDYFHITDHGILERLGCHKLVSAGLNEPLDSTAALKDVK
jgi:hypothetical protein